MTTQQRADILLDLWGRTRSFPLVERVKAMMTIADELDARERRPDQQRSAA